VFVFVLWDVVWVLKSGGAVLNDNGFDWLGNLGGVGW